MYKGLQRSLRLDVQSFYYKNAVEFRDKMQKVAHVLVMIGPGNADMWALSPSWSMASAKLCQAMADRRVCKHSGESLWTDIETVDGCHAKDAEDDRLLCGRYALNTIKFQTKAFELRVAFRTRVPRETFEHMLDNSEFAIQVFRDSENLPRFRSEFAQLLLAGRIDA